jgi:uncharacterized membrane protein YphA (DoxX/SURF4 family)
MFVATIILSALLALAYAMAGGQKIAGTKTMLDSADHLHVAHRTYRLIGVLELLAAIGLLAGLAFWPLGAAAAIGLVLLMIGAVVAHLRAGDGVARFGPAAALGVLALADAILRILSA